jgi:hypothetical protein
MHSSQGKNKGGEARATTKYIDTILTAINYAQLTSDQIRAQSCQNQSAFFTGNEKLQE